MTNQNVDAIIRATGLSDEFIEPIGLVAYNFSCLDGMLNVAIEFVFQGKAQEARVFTEQINSFATRLQIFRRLVKINIKEKSLSDDFSKLIRDLQNANKERNDILHAQWSGVYIKELAAEITRRKGKIKRIEMKVTPNEIREIGENMHRVHVSFFYLLLKYLYASWGEPFPLEEN